MMNYLAALLGLALMGAITTAAIYRGDAANWHEKFSALQSSYTQAAQQAKDDAAKQVAADKAENQRRADVSIAQAEAGKNAAQTALQSYLAKGKANKGTDAAHACFDLPIPSDMLPGQK